MKKVLFIFVLMLPVFTFISCSNDDNINDELNQYEMALIGLWENYPKSNYENFYFQMNEDGTGYQWVIEDDGEISQYGKEPFTWSANENTITMTTEASGTGRISYRLDGDILYVSMGDDSNAFKKNTINIFL